MSADICSFFIEEHQLIVQKSYMPLAHDFTCAEISTYAKELNLACLRYLEGAETCLFNSSQCYDILTIEIPALRTKSLSLHAKEALDGLEYAIKDSASAFVFLKIEGD